MTDYYNILGVDRKASASKIKKAYRDLALKYHPDRLVEIKDNKKKQEFEDKFKEIGVAYDVLSDPEKKRAYDSYGDDWKNNLNEKPPLFTCGKHRCDNQFEKKTGQPFISKNGMEIFFCSRQHAQDYLDEIERIKKGIFECRICGKNHRDEGVPRKCKIIEDAVDELEDLSHWHFFSSDEKDFYFQKLREVWTFYEKKDIEDRIKKTLSEANSLNEKKKQKIDQERNEWIQKLKSLAGWNQISNEKKEEFIKMMERGRQTSHFRDALEQAKQEMGLQDPDDDEEEDNENTDHEKLQYEIQKAISEIEDELNKEPKVTPDNEKWRTSLETASTLSMLEIRKQKILDDILAIREQQENQNLNLTELRKYTIHQINRALKNQNPPVSSDELINPDWETQINQAPSKNAINAIKNQVLADIKSRRELKGAANRLTELLAQAKEEKNWNDYQNLLNILQQIKNLRASDAYQTKISEIQALENRLNELNPSDYQETAKNLLDQRIKENGLTEDVMDDSTKQAIEEAKADPTNPEKIAKAEEKIIQNGTDNNLNQLLTQIQNQLKEGNLSSEDKKQLIQKIMEFTTGKDSYHAQAYLKKKDKVDALLSELRGEKNNNQQKPGISWPKKVGIAVLIVLPLMIVVLLLLRARRKRLAQRGWGG